MSDREKRPDETPEDENQRPTAPPPHLFDSPDDNEPTLLANIPEELIAESARPPNAAGPAGPKPAAAGLRQMFSRDPSPLREALPSAEEGDELLDRLFGESTAPPPAAHRAEAVRAPAPPLPPRPGAVPNDRPSSGGRRVPPPPPSSAGRRAPPPPPSSRGKMPPPLPRKPAMPPPPPGARRGVAPAPSSAEAHGWPIDEVATIADAPMGGGQAGWSASPATDRTASVSRTGVGDERDSHGEILVGRSGLPSLDPEFYDEDNPTDLDVERGSFPPAEPMLKTPLPSRPPPSLEFEAERQASDYLEETGQRAAWIARAEWLRAEAEAMTDKAARSRILLHASELSAMVGDAENARAAANEARDLAPSPLNNRQLRWLLGREGEWQKALMILDAETRSMTTPAARIHGVLLGAEIARRKLDDATAGKRIELAMRAKANDPRPHVQRLAEALGASDGASQLAGIRARLPDAPELSPLVAALAQIAANRGAVDRQDAAQGRPPASAYEATLRARTAIEAGDASSAVASLAALSGVASLSAGVSWLAGMIAASRPETRARSVEMLRRVVDGTHGDDARRALAARAIELGDADAAKSAMAAGEGFTAADRLALGALAGAPDPGGDDAVAEAVNDPDLVALAAAAAAASVDASGRAASDAAVRAVGSPASRASANLGRALASMCGATVPSLLSDGTLRAALDAYGETDPESGLLRVLGLELDAEAGDGAKIARAVSAWREGQSAEGERDRGLAGALLAEVAGDLEAALADLERARLADPTHEGAARIRASHADPATAAQMLGEHAAALEDGSRAAAVLTEAALRLHDARRDEDIETVLLRAAKADPSLPYAAYLGERAARARGDRDALVEWLRSRREASDDEREQALDLVREALLMSDMEGAPAAPLLEQALRSRPRDVGLRELYERLCPEPPADRAAWRSERSEEQGNTDGARLALEAALEYERTGDLERAAVCAQRAVALGDTVLAPLCVYRCALGGHGAGDLIDKLLPQAREAEPLDRLDIYERLADLDEQGRGDATSGLLWRRTILEDLPGHLPTLARIEAALISAGRNDELEPISLEIARATSGSAAVAHALISARIRRRNIGWDEMQEPVSVAYQHRPHGIWVLRQMSALAEIATKWDIAVEAHVALAERTDRPAEQATLLLRAAEDAAHGDALDQAQALLTRAIELVPGHVVAQLLLASVLERAGDAAAAAAALERVASASVLVEQRAVDLYRAALLWSDKVGDRERAKQALEAVAEMDPTYEDVFVRLQTIYLAEGARGELAALLERRLQNVTDPKERVDMEVLRGRALAEVGEVESAKQALAAALEEMPDHPEALSAFADLSAKEGDWSGAEQAWIRLARLLPDAEQQANIYLRLGEVYDQHLPNAERAELAYQEILKRLPGDERAREHLVALYSKSGNQARALEEQQQLIDAVSTPEGKCKRTTELANVYEASGELKRAEATLLQARKTWPRDGVALGALVRFYQRTNQDAAANVLLERAAADARRALITGRFEPHLFTTIAAVSELRGRPDGARVARAAVDALSGEDVKLTGAGGVAGDPRLDDLLAPEVMTPAFRELLRRTGPLLDSAIPFDLGSVRATPITAEHGDLYMTVQALATSYQLLGVQAYVSGVLPLVCVPATSYPPTLVLGQPLVESPRYDVRTFLIHRALKVLQASSGAFARTAPIDLWPLLAAYLKLFSPSWMPTGVDASRFNDAYARISRASAGRTDPQLGVLAADVIGSIGNRASTLNTVVNGWGDRAGLLAVGDPNIGLTAVAWSAGNTAGPPVSGKERLTWIGRNSEARELIVFSVSDAYVDARARLGLDAI